MPCLLKHTNKGDKLACEIATLVYDKYLIEAYGITNCNINYTRGDLVEKILLKDLDDLGVDCRDMPLCTKREALELETLAVPSRHVTFPINPLPNPRNPIDVIYIQSPIPDKDGFVYIQPYPSTTWVINHDLPFIPNVTLVDDNGNTIDGQIQYLSSNSNGGTIQIIFSIPVIGRAYLS